MRSPLVYVCVYRQVLPARKVFWDLADEAAQAYPDLASLLRRYRAHDSVYDWGDDPSFFCAEYHHGRAEHAAWGVCRPNIRAKLHPGDIVVFFCARQFQRGTPTEYFYVGVGTVGRRVDDRREIWAEEAQPELQLYRQHLNVLVRFDRGGEASQYERFAPGHPDDWPRCAASPYIVFDAARSKFNLRAPLLVATAVPGAKREEWLLDQDQRIPVLHAALFTEPGVTRRLRTSDTGSAHPHINLTRKLTAAGLCAEHLRDRLALLV